MCEMGVLYGWKYMADKLLKLIQEEWNNIPPTMPSTLAASVIYDKLKNKLDEIQSKKNYAHYFDIRTNHLNEKDWRRSFSINQMLYGMILYATEDHMLHNSFDEILPILQQQYGTSKEEEVSEWR